MSHWQEVSSEDSQGFVLCPLLYNIYANDLDAGMGSVLIKFTGDKAEMGCKHSGGQD